MQYVTSVVRDNSCSSNFAAQTDIHLGLMSMSIGWSLSWIQTFHRATACAPHHHSSWLSRVWVYVVGLVSPSTGGLAVHL